MPANSSALPCPHCGATTSAVVDSRPSEKAIHRRRRCDSCGCRFSTWEIIGDYSPLHASQRLTEIATRLRTTADHVDAEVATLLRLRT